MKNLTIFSIFIFFMAVLLSIARANAQPAMIQVNVGGLIQTIALTDSISESLEASDSAYILKSNVLQARAQLEKLNGQLEPLSKASLYRAIKDLAQAQCTLYQYLGRGDPSNFAYTYTAKKFEGTVTAYADKLKRVSQ